MLQNSLSSDHSIEIRVFVCISVTRLFLSHPVMPLCCVSKRELVNAVIVSSVKTTAAVGPGVGESLCVCSGVCMCVCVNGNPVDPDDLSFILYEYACRGSG